MAQRSRKQAVAEAIRALSPEAAHVAVRDELHRRMRGAVLMMVADLFDQEVLQLCGPPWSRKPAEAPRRGGSEPGRILVAGQQVAVRRPRVRRGRQEEPIRAYTALQSCDMLSQDVQRCMLRGVSSREYDDLLQNLEGGLGLPRSMVSRAFVRASQRSLEQINGRSLSQELIVALFVDAQEFAGLAMVVAMGVTSDGRKVLLGLREGHTENAEVVAELLENLVSRGLALTEYFLGVIDGAKALRAALVRRWGSRILIQRCQVHKKRNVLEHLPPKWHAEVGRRLSAAYGMKDYDEALQALTSTVAWLEQVSETAAGSLREGLEETITVVKLGLPNLLRRTLATTNPLESIFDSVRYRTGRVKRWRRGKGQMRARWVASALLLVEKRLHKIRGHAVMAVLLEALKREGVDIKRKVA